MPVGLGLIRKILWGIAIVINFYDVLIKPSKFKISRKFEKALFDYTKINVVPFCMFTTNIRGIFGDYIYYFTFMTRGTII